MIDWFIPRASTFAGDIDGLILLILVLVGFWFLVAEGVFFWLIFKYRQRPGSTRRGQYITGERAEETRWIGRAHILILICDVFIVSGAIRVWIDVKQTLPPAQETVKVIGQQWAWTFVHPGPDGRLDTADDISVIDELHIKVGTTYHYKLTSRDVLHSFSVPAFRFKHDAIPGREIVGWFKATRTGQYDIQCAEICGIGHGIMGARIFIETPEQHQAWMAKHAATPGAAPAAPQK